MAGEKLGVPSLGVMTEKFVSSAALMARVLGAPGFRFAVIAHPMSSAPDELLAERAREALKQGIPLLIEGG